MKPRFGDKNWKPAKRKYKFNPDSEYISKAIEDYLNSGGKITRVDVVEDSQSWIRENVSEFLTESDFNC